MLKAILTVLLLVLAWPAWAAVVCNNETQDGESPPAANPQTTAYTPDAGSNRIVIVAVTMRDTDADNTTIDSVSSSAGGTWTQYGTATASGGADFRTSIFYSTDFADGAQTLSTTYSTTVLQGAVTVYTCTGVNTSSPWRGVAVTATGTATTATVDVTSTASGDLVIDALNAGQLDTGISPTLGSGQTSMYNYATGGDNLDNAGSTEPGTGGTVTMSWTSLTGVNAWSMVAGALRSASTAATRYVAPAASGGSNSNSCDASQNISTPKLTFLSAIACMAAGDTLYARAGTYTEIQPLYLVSKNGSPGLEYTISGYQSEVVTLAPSSATASGRALIVSGSSYITITKLVFDGISATTDAASNRIEFSNHITISNNEIKRWLASGLIVTSSSDNVTISNNSIHDMTDTCAAAHRPYGIYFHDGINGVIEKNDIYNNGGGGMQAYPGNISGLVIRYNLVHGNNVCPGSAIGGILVGTDGAHTNTGTIIHNNVVYNNESSTSNDTAHGINIYINASGTKIYNNVIYANDGNGIQFAGSSSNSEARNNIITANSLAEVSPAGTNNTYTYNACTAGETCTTANKLTISAVTSCTVSTSDFRQKAGSSCIGQGTALSGYLYNGAAPDIGAFETFGFTSAGITGNTLDVQLGMNVNIPVLPASGQTTWTVGCTGVGCGTRTVTAAAKKSGTDSVVSLTVDGAVCTDVQTWTVTYAVGTVTDSALMGNSLNQNMTAFATQAVTNNCGTPAAVGTLEQKTHQFTQSQTPGNPLSAVGAASTDVRTGTSFALVTQIDCTVAACDPIGLRLYYRKNAGAYQAVPDTLGDEVAFLGATSDPAYLSGAIACCLSGALTPNTGTTGFTSAAIPVFTLTQNSSIVQRRQLIVSPNAFPTDTYEFKEYNQTGVVLGGGYTPAAGAKITVSSAPFDAPTGLQLAYQAGGNVALTWTASTDTALLGYRIYQSAVQGVQGDLVATITPTSAIATHTPITTWHGHLTPGTWYFLVTQFDTGNQESPIPPEVTVVAPAAIARTARTP